MQTYEILVKERSVKGNSRDMTLVRTSAGIDQIHVLFDNAEWLGFPVTVTFANGDTLITQPLTVSEVDDSEWALEGTCTIPWEVIGSTGSIRLTFQGTDAEGRHIITAEGAPLSVEEAGDIVSGLDPSSTITPSELEQAYANAMAVINEAQSLVSNLQSRLDDMVADAVAAVGTYELPVASETVLGGVKVGDGLKMADDRLSLDESAVPEQSGMTDAERATLKGLKTVVDGTMDYKMLDGELTSITVKPSAMPIATLDNLGMVYPDGTTVQVDSDGMMHVEQAYVPTATVDDAGIVRPDGTTITVDGDGTIHSSSSYELPPATTAVLGGVKPDGTTITADPDGTIHGADATPVATTSAPGKVRPDGTTITVDNDGTIHGATTYTLPRASESVLGGVKVDGTTITSNDGVISAVGTGGPRWEVRTDSEGKRRLAIVIPEA